LYFFILSIVISTAVKSLEIALSVAVVLYLPSNGSNDYSHSCLNCTSDEPFHE